MLPKGLPRKSRELPTSSRFADDALCHCVSEEQAKKLRDALEKRFAECGLQLHPEKTKIVYCKDDDRRGNFLHEKFDFLGLRFSGQEIEESLGKVLRQLQSGRKQRSNEGNS